ncbi:class I SAM-dependent methyltransferase [Rhizobium sp. TRM95111]|uniref:class I SAM-dependent methyltransferase n=1 Tax=Rhizobium alarense TaxID=2846851 RepID=UPI001F44804A|nr:class I SAM-dependent methyltransferase [Rhizobium alarense]MCF3642656.1 class I SAM-dependent methyltransferase [Rhizobium alarense]
MNTISENRPSTDADAMHDACFDLARGIAAYTASSLVAGLARVIGRHPDADIANAFNHKQVASKRWACDKLFETLGGHYERIVIVGGWYGILAAMLFDDPRFSPLRITSIDIDAAVETVARTLNQAAGARFDTMTADMYAVDYGALGADLVVNTSCEHIADVAGWLARLPRGSRVLLQSNDYFAEPTHINCVPSVEAFAGQAKLASLQFAGGFRTKNYTRFMLIGAT